MEIHSSTGGLAATNCYLLIDETTATAALVDAPGDTTGPLLELCKTREVTLTHLLLTHGHWDHISDHAVVTRAFPNAKVLMHRLEEPKLQRPGSVMWQLPYEIPPRNADGYVAEGDTVQVGSLALRVMHTPGHAVGHCCFYLEAEGKRVLFAGDLLMAGTVGRYDLPGDGDLAMLIESLRRVMALADDTHVLSGHGERTKIGHERNGNAFLRGRGIVGA